MGCMPSLTVSLLCHVKVIALGGLPFSEGNGGAVGLWIVQEGLGGVKGGQTVVGVS